MNVQDLLEQKGSVVWSIDPSVSVFEAIKVLEEKSIGALPVVEQGKLIGILSERDYARKVVLKDRSSRETKVKEIMSAEVHCVKPERSIQDCMVIMNKYKIRHLPVMHHDKLVGMVSIGDVVQSIIEEQKLQIEHLEHTISWAESY